MKRKTVERLDQGALWLPMAKLTIKGVPSWSRFLRPTNDVRDRVASLAGQQAIPRQDGAQPGIFDYLVVECPRCGYTKRSHPDRLLGAARWRYSWCGGTCQRNINASLWMCTCRKLWHACHIHAVCAPPPPKRTKVSNTSEATLLAQQRPLICSVLTVNAYTQHKRPRPRITHILGDARHPLPHANAQRPVVVST